MVLEQRSVWARSLLIKNLNTNNLNSHELPHMCGHHLFTFINNKWLFAEPYAVMRFSDSIACNSECKDIIPIEIKMTSSYANGGRNVKYHLSKSPCRHWLGHAILTGGSRWFQGIMYCTYKEWCSTTNGIPLMNDSLDIQRELTSYWPIITTVLKPLHTDNNTYIYNDSLLILSILMIMHVNRMITLPFLVWIH